MIELTIPGFNDHLSLTDLILDFNGTLAIDGKMIDGVKERLVALSKVLTIHVVTGNSNGTAEQELKGIPCKIALLPPENQAKEKYQYLTQLNPASAISIGNGRNDCLLLESSAIGVIVVQQEGAAVDTLSHADIVCNSIITALDLIVNVRRLTATLRS